jgi:hypothetical protein
MLWNFMKNSDISLAHPVTWQNSCLLKFERAKIVFKNNTPRNDGHSYKSHLHMKFAKIQYFLHFLGEFTFY